MNQFYADIIRDVLTPGLQLGALWIAGNAVSIGAKIVNAFITSQQVRYDLANKNAMFNQIVESAKIDSEEEAKIQAWTQEGVKFAFEKGYQKKLAALTNPDEKPLTPEEKTQAAVDYVKEKIKVNISNPDKQNQYLEGLEKTVLATLGDFRSHFEHLYDSLFQKKLDAKSVILLGEKPKTLDELEKPLKEISFMSGYPGVAKEYQPILANLIKSREEDLVSVIKPDTVSVSMDKPLIVTNNEIDLNVLRQQVKTDQTPASTSDNKEF